MEQEDLSLPSVPKFPVENDSQSSPTRDEVPEDTPISSMPIEMDPCSSTPESDPNTSLIDGKSQSVEDMSENSDIPLTNLLNDTAPGKDTLDVGLPPTSSLSDSQVKDASDLLLVEDDLCLGTLTMSYISMPKNVLLPSPKRENLKALVPCPLPVLLNLLPRQDNSENLPHI